MYFIVFTFDLSLIVIVDSEGVIAVVSLSAASLSVVSPSAVSLSCVSGFVAGVNAALLALGKEEMIFPRTTEIGALANYVSEGGVSSSFQPMNANFGIIAPLDKKVKGGKKFRNEAYAVRSLEVIKTEYAQFFENKV